MELHECFFFLEVLFEHRFLKTLVLLQSQYYPIIVTYGAPTLLYLHFTKYGVITNDMSDYIYLLLRIAHIICNHPVYSLLLNDITTV
jgi:hypothetical protein